MEACDATESAIMHHANYSTEEGGAHLLVAAAREHLAIAAGRHKGRAHDACCVALSASNAIGHWARAGQGRVGGTHELQLRPYFMWVLVLKHMTTHSPPGMRSCVTSSNPHAQPHAPESVRRMRPSARMPAHAAGQDGEGA